MKEWHIFLPGNGIIGELFPTVKDFKSFVPSALLKYSTVGQLNITVNPNFHCSFKSLSIILNNCALLLPFLIQFQVKISYNANLF